MRRKLLRILSFVLSLVILSVSLTGCDFIWNFGHPGRKFSKMEYKRPDMDKIYSKLDELIDMIENNRYGYNTLRNKLVEFTEKYYYDFLTMSTLSFVKFVITPDSDELFEEYYYLADETGNLSAKMEDLFVACAQSKHCSKFERDCFGEGELEEYKEGAAHTDKSIELMSAEARIVADYKNLCADESAAPEQFGALYTDLVRTRLLLSEELGFDSYADYAFSALYRDYTPGQAFSYIDDIAEYIAPIFNERASSSQMWEGTNRALSADELIETAGEITEKMGYFTKEPYGFMNKNELLYVAKNDFAVTESFTTYFQSYNCPFIYISSGGTLDDIMTLIHEFGHFTDSYYNYNQDYILDLCEIFSQAMELLSLSYLSECSSLSEEDVSYLKTYTYDTILSVFVQQALFTRFEEKVYSLGYDDVTVENINKAAKESLEEFGLIGILDSFETEWYEITHFFNQAFYVISYLTSCDAALQIYGISLDDTDDGLDKYMDLMSLDYGKNFIENLERVGLESPFAEGRVRQTAGILSKSFD